MPRRETGNVKLNLGCGHITPAGWTNVDYFIGARLMNNPLGRLASRLFRPTRISWSPNIYIHDLRRPLPWPDGSTDVVYSSHSLEHLELAHGRQLLRECHRILGPGGILRIVVPDLEHFVDLYKAGNIEAVDFLDRLSVFSAMPGDGPLRRLIGPLVRFPHKCMYDRNTLLAEVSAAGFEAAPREPFDSAIEDIRQVERADGTVGAVIVEGIRHG